MEDQEDAPAWLNVSRETLEELRMFCRMVEKWNPAINLISKAGIGDLWRRHVLDSAQLYQLAPAHFHLWCDIGSGGGFPGVVVAIIAKAKNPDARFILIESDRRKAVFLMQAARTFALPLSVLTGRIEDAVPQNADIVSARALAPLSVLCELAERHIAPHGHAIFPKGMTAREELAVAQKRWFFTETIVPSLTDLAASVILLRDIKHV